MLFLITLLASTSVVMQGRSVGRRSLDGEGSQGPEQIEAAPKPELQQKENEATLPLLPVERQDQVEGQEACMQCGTRSAPVWRSGPPGTPPGLITAHMLICHHKVAQSVLAATFAHHRLAAL